MDDAVAQRQDRAVLTLPRQAFGTAAVGLERQADRSVERRPRIPEAGEEQIEASAPVVAPPLPIERVADRVAVAVHPVRLVFRDVEIDRLRRRRKEHVLGLPVVVDEEDRIPFAERLHDRSGLRLRDEERVAVEIDLIVVVVRAHSPRRVVLGRVRVRRALAADLRGVVPRHEALVALRVVRGVDDGDEAVEDQARRLVRARRALVAGLNRRLEGGRLVAVVRMVHPRDRRHRRGNRVRLGVVRRPRVGELVHRRLDPIEPRDVCRRRDDDEVQRALLERLAVPDDPDALVPGECGEPSLEPGIVRVVGPDGVAEHRFRCGDIRIVRPAGEEFEPLRRSRHAGERQHARHCKPHHPRTSSGLRRRRLRLGHANVPHLTPGSRPEPPRS